ncbi:hypothetical protein IWW38_003745, partial [Coemansia aciculifera]
ESGEEIRRLREENQRLREENRELIQEAADSAEDDGGALEDALAHYAGLLRGIGEARRADKEQWRAERGSLRDRVRGLELRLAQVGIGRDHVAQLLALTDDARKHMVGEARALYVELEDAAGMAYSRMDAADELAADLARTLVLDDDSGGDVSEAVGAEARRTFVDTVALAAEARVASAVALAAVSELRLMRVQGHVVEAVAEISAKHKLRVGDMERETDAVRQLLRDRDARVRELELDLANRPSTETNDDASSPLHEQVAALQLQLRAMEDMVDDHEAFAEASARKANDMETRCVRSRATLEEYEVNMRAHVEAIDRLRRQLVEVESDRAIMAENADFRSAWLKDNYAQAYRGLMAALQESGDRHAASLGQRIKYVHALKSQILVLKQELAECTRDRDRFGHHVRLLKSELDAYREVGEDDAKEIRERSRLPAVALRTRSRKTGVKGLYDYSGEE